MTASNPPQVPMQPRAPATATSFLCNPAPHHPSNLAPESSTESILSHQKTSATVTDSQYCPAPFHPMNLIPSTRAQHILHKTSATAADLQYNPAPHHPQNPQSTCRPFPLKSDTFWTSCNRCRIQYEYRKIYLNQKLLCHHCQQPFMAIEMLALNANVCSSLPSPFHNQWPAIFAASKDSRSVPASSTRPIQTATAVQPSGQSLKRGHEGAVNMARGAKALHKNTTAPEKVDAASAFNAGSSGLKGEKPSKMRRVDGQQCTNKGSQVTPGSRSGCKRRLANLNRNFGAEQVVSSRSNKPRGLKELTQADIRSMLMGKGRTEIIHQLNKWKTAESSSLHMEKVETKKCLEML